MRAKRVISTIAIVGGVCASTLGIGAGAANAHPAQQDSGAAQSAPAVMAPETSSAAAAQPAGWHGGGQWDGWGHGRWGGWRVIRSGTRGDGDGEKCCATTYQHQYN
jgi:hypothetical protein